MANAYSSPTGYPSGKPSAAAREASPTKTTITPAPGVVKPGLSGSTSGTGNSGAGQLTPMTDTGTGGAPVKINNYTNPENDTAGTDSPANTNNTNTNNTNNTNTTNPNTTGTGTGTGTGSSDPADDAGPEAQPRTVSLDAEYRKSLTGENLDPVNIDRVGKYDKTELVNNLQQQIEAARQQYNLQIDNGTDNAVTELRRALDDAQGSYTAQQGAITAEEMAARDNAALYAEARGDKGGIGASQYQSIQNTAAINRQTVRNAQIKLGTDTNRQIADLRAKGEFDKADRMLQLTQSYLSELRSIEQFAANYNLSVDQINTAIAEWEAEYNKSMQQFKTSTELSLASQTGQFGDGSMTLGALNEAQTQLAGIAMSLLQSGMSPDKLTGAQRNALATVYGADAAQIAALGKLYGKKSGGGGGGSLKAGTGLIDEALAALLGGASPAALDGGSTVPPVSKDDIVTLTDMLFATQDGTGGNSYDAILADLADQGYDPGNPLLQEHVKWARGK